MARFLNRIFKKPIFMDWEKCLGCYYRGSIGNHSPCYQCRGNNRFEPENGFCFTTKVIKTKTKEMTLEEIEKKLGHKIKIVNK